MKLRGHVFWLAQSHEATKKLINPVRAELVEVLFFFRVLKTIQTFDRLRASGVEPVSLWLSASQSSAAHLNKLTARQAIARRCFINIRDASLLSLLPQLALRIAAAKASTTPTRAADLYLHELRFALGTVPAQIQRIFARG